MLQSGVLSLMVVKAEKLVYLNSENMQRIYRFEWKKVLT